MDGLDEAWFVAWFPADPTATAHAEGAPVVVGAVPSLYAVPHVEPQLNGAWGFVELQPVYPGWTLDDVMTPGEPDLGGAVSAAMLAAAVDFALGRTRTVDALSLAQVASTPVCEEVVLLGGSTGGLVAAQALEVLDTDGLGGFACYECPNTPQAAAGDLGMPWMDPDASVDADGDGVAWDDGRNPTYVAGACSGETCALDYGRLAWDPAADPTPASPSRFRGVPAGALFLDGDGDGRLGLTAAGSMDVDDSGAIEADEDFLLLPHWEADAAEPLERFSPEATAAASAVFGDDWPEQVAGSAEAEDFWGDRSLMRRLAAVDGLPVALLYTAEDHGVSVADRPHVLGLYDALMDRGVAVRANPSAAVMACAVADELWAGWGGALEWEQALDADTLEAHALPEAVPAGVAVGLSAVSLAWDLWGPFDRCDPVAEE